MITTACLPPPILQYFDRLLLSRPMPKFCDDSETLWKFYEYISFNLVRKAKKSTPKRDKCETLINEFLGLYERIKTKEKELETKTGYAGKGPFYYFDAPRQNGREVFKRLRQRSRKSYI